MLAKGGDLQFLLHWAALALAIPLLARLDSENSKAAREHFKRNRTKTTLLLLSRVMRLTLLLRSKRAWGLTDLDPASPRQ
jgi:hypothetical protein